MVEETQNTVNEKEQKKKDRKKLMKQILSSWELYVFLLPAFIYFILFEYAPMYGLQIAFKDYRAVDVIFRSQSLLFLLHTSFFVSCNFSTFIRYLLIFNLCGLIFPCPIPIILALSIKQLMNKKYTKLLQTVTNTPPFISTVVMAVMF